MYRKEGRDLLSPMETDGFTAPWDTAYFNWMLLQWHLKALSRTDGPPERPCIYVQQKQVLVPKTLHSKRRKEWEQSSRGEKYMYYHSAIKGLVLLVANDTTESPWKLKGKYKGHCPLVFLECSDGGRTPSGLCASAAPHSTWKAERESKELSLPSALTSYLCSCLLESLFNPALQM